MHQSLLPTLLAVLPAAPPADQADAIWLGGTIYTVDAKFSKAEALAVRDGKILAADTTAEVKKLAGPATRIHQLEGRCVTPGLIDCHGHLASLGSYSAGWLDLHDARSFGEVVGRVREAAAKARPGEGILGGRWDQSLWGESAFPTHQQLSAAAPEVPVWLERVDGHAGLANRKALAIAGVGPQTPAPAGGEIVRDAAGEPTGILLDNATP